MGTKIEIGFASIGAVAWAALTAIFIAQIAMAPLRKAAEDVASPAASPDLKLVRSPCTPAVGS
jgi:predicted small integral membrane protein